MRMSPGGSRTRCLPPQADGAAPRALRRPSPCSPGTAQAERGQAQAVQLWASGQAVPEPQHPPGGSHCVGGWKALTSEGGGGSVGVGICGRLLSFVPFLTI